MSERRDDDEATLADEPPPTEEERAAADRLRAHLDEAAAPIGLDDEAAALALLRASRPGGLELTELRREAILRRVWPRSARGRLARVGALATLLSAAAAVVLVLRSGERPPPATERPPATESALPRPPRALLEAQLAAARGDPRALDVELPRYRRRVEAALLERYRGGPR